jgi:hypothetical protein
MEGCSVMSKESTRPELANDENQELNTESQPLKGKRDLIEWRYDKEIGYASKGCTQAEIAKLLKLDESTISKDFKKLRERAKTGISKYIEDRLPFEHQKAVVGLDEIIKQGWAFALNSAHDPRLRVQALGVISDAIMKKQQVLGDAEQIDMALRAVVRLKEQLKQ